MIEIHSHLRWLENEIANPCITIVMHQNKFHEKFWNKKQLNFFINLMSIIAIFYLYGKNDFAEGSKIFDWFENIFVGLLK